jgi:hypothetical protein
MDLNNEFFTYNQPRKHYNLLVKIPKEITEMIKESSIIKPECYKYFLQNPYIKDNRLETVILFLLFMKYYTKIINLNSSSIKFDVENDKSDKNEIENIIKKIFGDFIEKANREFIDIYQNINKIKDDKKLEYFYYKESNSPKDNLYKSMHQKHYEYLLNLIKKYKINCPLDSLINDIKTKFKKEMEEEENTKSNNLLLGKYSTGSINFPSKEDMYNVEINTTEENHLENNEEQQNKNEINENNEKDKYTIIEKAKNNDFIDYDINEAFEILNNENIDDDENNFSNYFIDSKNQILCTKRDLVLKNLAYFFHEDYFSDKNFINLRRKFMHIYPPELPKNNYNNSEKQMTIKFPSTMKNFSNSDLYYPRIFLRPDKKFFKNQFFKVGHEYFHEYKNINKPNFDYGHGLLYQDNFELFEIISDKKEKRKKSINNYDSNISTPCYEAELISSNNNYQGFVILKEYYFVYQTNMAFDFNKYNIDMKYIISSKIEDILRTQKQIIIPYKYIKQIIKRKFIFFDQAFEIFLYNGKSYFFNLYIDNKNEDFFKKIETINKEQNTNIEIIKDMDNYFVQKKYTTNWLEKKISTLEYLLLINKFSGRTYNDLSQYIILPWTLKDYLDINDKQYIRDFSLPMSVQEKENLELIKSYYDNDDDPNRSYFKCHYSNSSYVFIYLFRINPFSNNQIKLQSGKFDNPHRLIACLQDICNIFKDNKETCELIPEYYYLIESFLNINYNFFGFLDKKIKNILNNLRLTKDFDSLFELLLFHQNFLNSEEISSQVHKWINNIYGENQMTNKKNVINSFPFECYEKNVKENIGNRIKELKKNKNENIEKGIKNIRSNLMMSYLFGQCPKQLFKKSHPQYQARTIENNYNKIFMKNEMKKLSDKQFFFMNENLPTINNSESNYIYIITDKDILVFNKQMKQFIQLSLNNIKKIRPIFQNNNVSNQKNEGEKNDLNNDVNNDSENVNNDNKKVNNDSENVNNTYNILFYKQYFYKRLIFEIEECKFFFIGGYLDNSYKIYFKNKEKTCCCNYITNSLITCMQYMKKTKIFFTGHINGQIMKWQYNIINKLKDSSINCVQISSLLAHKSGVSLIQIHDKLELLLSSSDKDGLIFIRKIYDYELLSVIQYNNLNKQIMDIIIDKEYFIITYNYKKIINKKIQKIVTYSVNGIKLSKIKIVNENDDENNVNNNILSPICIQQSNDTIFMLSKNQINLMNITGKNKIELIPFEEGLIKCLKKNRDITSQINSDFINDFNDKLKNNIIISYFYDFNSHILFCLFNEGNLYRINLYPKDLIKKDNLNN